MMWVIKHWLMSPRDVVDALPMEVFNTRLDRTLSNLI